LERYKNTNAGTAIILKIVRKFGIFLVISFLATYIKAITKATSSNKMGKRNLKKYSL
jgi:hypothetical protein